MSADLEPLIARVVAIYQKRGWALDWRSRGVYLHIEASELIEAVRGKGDSTPTEEAADVLMVLLSILGANGITWDAVLQTLRTKLAILEIAPRYAGEAYERSAEDTLQTALDAAKPGDTVVVPADTYQGTLTLLVNDPEATHGYNDNAPALSEAELRKAEHARPKSLAALEEYIAELVEREHDYGTCVYAMSLAACAAFEYVASQLGVTGFQASCAEMDIFRRLRRLEHGFQVLNYEYLLYPQYCTDEHFPSWEALIEEHKEHLAEAAQKKLADAQGNAHPDVLAHWEWLSSLAPEPT